VAWYTIGPNDHGTHTCRRSFVKNVKSCDPPTTSAQPAVIWPSIDEIGLAWNITPETQRPMVGANCRCIDPTDATWGG
jgi:hypothetical protein